MEKKHSGTHLKIILGIALVLAFILCIGIIISHNREYTLDMAYGDMEIIDMNLDAEPPTVSLQFKDDIFSNIKLEKTIDTGVLNQYEVYETTSISIRIPKKIAKQGNLVNAAGLLDGNKVLQDKDLVATYGKVMQIQPYPIQEAIDYNNAHPANNMGDVIETLQFQVEDEEYASLLNYLDDGTMGSIMIPSIDLEFPIYHSLDTETLKLGPVHVYGSSLPVGCAGTHTVIYGYRAIPEQNIFLDLPSLGQGDTVEIGVAGQRLNYRVINTITCEPEEVGDYLTNESGKDLLTLVTETPFGINTQRFLVRCIREEQYEEEIAGIPPTLKEGIYVYQTDEDLFVTPKLAFSPSDQLCYVTKNGFDISVAPEEYRIDGDKLMIPWLGYEEYVFTIVDSNTLRYEAGLSDEYIIQPRVHERNGKSIERQKPLEDGALFIFDQELTYESYDPFAFNIE